MAGERTDEQNNAIAADYFAMLDNDIAGRPYNKAARIARASAAIPGVVISETSPGYRSAHPD